MKKILLLVLTLVSVFLLTGCEREESRTAEGWAVYAVETGYDGTDLPITPYLIHAEETSIVWGDDSDDFDHFATFIITIVQDADGDPTERTFAVFVGWQKSFWMRVSQSTVIPESALRDIDVVEIPK